MIVEIKRQKKTNRTLSPTIREKKNFLEEKSKSNIDEDLIKKAEKIGEIIGGGSASVSIEVLIEVLNCNGLRIPLMKTEGKKGQFYCPKKFKVLFIVINGKSHPVVTLPTVLQGVDVMRVTREGNFVIITSQPSQPSQPQPSQAQPATAQPSQAKPSQAQPSPAKQFFNEAIIRLQDKFNPQKRIEKEVKKN